MGDDAEGLTHEQKEALDRLGYLVFPDVVDSEGLACLRAAFEDRATGGAQNERHTGTRHVDLSLSDDVSERVLNHPKVAAVCRYVLGRPFSVRNWGGRDPLPGYGQQGLHTDALPRSASDPYSVVTALWLLDDFTPENGATRLLPGSHLLTRPLPKSLQAPVSRHRDEIRVVARAGSVLVFNGHLWHGGTRNLSQSPRRVIQCQFVPRRASVA